MHNLAEHCSEEVGKILSDNDDLAAMRDVAAKGEKQYLRTRNGASTESVKRAKQLANEQDYTKLNPLFEGEVNSSLEQERLNMLAVVSGFRPQETVFEIGKRGTANTELSDLMKKRRAKFDLKSQLSQDTETIQHSNTTRPTNDTNVHAEVDSNSEEELELTRPDVDMDEASDSELELTFALPDKPSSARKPRSHWQDSEHFMGYQPATMNINEDRGYGVHSGSNANFVQAARGAAMDLMNDESKSFAEPSRTRGLRWDKKSRKYVARANDEDGSKGNKMVLGESGHMIPASFRSGRFDAWRKANKVERLPAVGELERNASRFVDAPRTYKHKMVKAPKDADKYRDDYEKRKKRVAVAREKRIGRFAEGKGQERD